MRALFLTCAVMLGAALGIALVTHEEERTAEQPRTQLTAAQLAELHTAPPQPAAPAPRTRRAPPPPPDDFAPDQEFEDGNGS